ncbi:GNAT family N-acetyltransferase [Albimonas pacifica]|uniref:Protein N-acetyltransferase, RimJ/RimL family n=1 Tax=Albimonas pacifica TaxID=1114924 RepID=A0A1I3BTY5_9RHOB|nr:GNAT family N-acetyltransferase [Albimonas pacifica]SFH65778.1 Protein N-acetyltransferase, RimJ/RimL family [Albimonas pacifica]
MGPGSRGPIFETARLRLRPRGPQDLTACLAMDREPETTRWIAGPWADPEAHAAFLRARIEAEHGEGLGYWVVVPREAPERFLGWVMLTPDGAGEIEIGWRLSRAARGGGVATEAALPVARHAVETLGLARIVADIMPGNAGSRRVAEKIGMRPRPEESPDPDHLRHVLTAADLPGAGA